MRHLHLAALSLPCPLHASGQPLPRLGDNRGVADRVRVEAGWEEGLVLGH